ncbi:MAG: flagellin [Desulfotignum sp.]|nr:flagellin [Desulfotignum sp.]MCF8136425.1 flagellin [Desulfotignum sp.]
MAISINSNIASLNAQRNLNNTSNVLNNSMKRLSSGLRINSAKDDAAGLSIANRMSSQVRGLNQAARNANDGISMAQVAEGAMQEVSNNLQRIRELAVQASSDSNSATDRAALNDEVTQLVAEISRVAENTSFNGTNLLDGSFGSKNIQVGANSGETIEVSMVNVKADSLGVGSASSYSATVSGAVVTGDGLGAGDLTINGYQISASSDDGVSTAKASGSAIAMANAINARTGDTGVTASVEVATVEGSAIASGKNAITANDILINGVDIGAIDASTTSASIDRGADVAAAINAVSDQTGVTATFDTSDGSVDLTSIDGRNITITYASGMTSNVTGLKYGGASSGVQTVYSSVNLSSSSQNGITIGGDSQGNAGLTDGYTSATATAGAGVSSLDLTTQAGASSAIATVDAALASIDSARGDLGAIQNRFESTIANLQNVSENVSAARSRIMDADFAAETAAMTKAQVMQQAGTAMLAQANQLPQIALSLLQ